MSSSARRDIRFRVYMAFTGICLFGFAIIVKAFYIQHVERKDLHAKATELNKRFRFDTLVAERGSIYNEDGILLCSSVPEFDVVLDFSVMNPDSFNAKVDSLSVCLANFFKEPQAAQQYKAEFIRNFNKRTKYYPLCNNLNFLQYDTLRSFPILNKRKGLYGFSSIKRNPPYKNLAYRTLGVYRGSKSTGLEMYYNDTLTGENGICQSQKTAAGWIPIDETVEEPTNGMDIVTTLDMNIQEIAEQALLHQLQEKHGEYGSCIVMEVKTGKIRALANLGLQSDSTYRENYNYALIPSEPGSTFKLVTLISLLKDKLINVEDMVDPEGGRVRFGDYVMKDSHGMNGSMPIWKAFAESSNCAMAKLARKYYGNDKDKFLKHIHELTLDSVTFIDLPGEQRPRLNFKTKTWGATTLPWMATGYSIAISPMQTCMLYNSIANNGKMMKPYLVSGLKQYGKVVRTFEPTVIADNIVDSASLVQLRKCLNAVVSEGTAKGIQSPYFTMAGKTGTAQVTDGTKIRYTDGVYHGSFVGYFPTEAPKYTICVVIRTLKHAKEYYGVATAAPVFRQVASKIFADNIGSFAAPLDSFAKTGSRRLVTKMATTDNYRLLLQGINKQETLPADYKDKLMQITVDSAKRLSIQKGKLYLNVMPDVKGMGLKDAVYMLEVCGLKVKIKGKGRVQVQSVPPGSRVNKGQNIVLELS